MSSEISTQDVALRTPEEAPTPRNSRNMKSTSTETGDDGRVQSPRRNTLSWSAVNGGNDVATQSRQLTSIHQKTESASRMAENEGIHFVIDPKERPSVHVSVLWAENTDIDVACILFDKEKNVVDVANYRNVQSRCRSIIHMGTDVNHIRAGSNGEYVEITFERIPSSVHYVAVVASSYSVDITFDDIASLGVCVTGMGNGDAIQELCSLEFPGCSGTSVMTSLFTRQGRRWHFWALSTAGTGHTTTQFLRNKQNLEILDDYETNTLEQKRLMLKVVDKSQRRKVTPAERLRKGIGSTLHYSINYGTVSYDNQRSPRNSEKKFSLGNIAESEENELRVRVVKKWRNIRERERFLGELKLSSSKLYDAASEGIPIEIALDQKEATHRRSSSYSGTIQCMVAEEKEDEAQISTNGRLAALARLGHSLLHGPISRKPIQDSIPVR